MRDNRLWNEWCDRLGVSRELPAEDFLRFLLDHKDSILVKGELEGKTLLSLFDSEELTRHGIVVLGRLDSLSINTDSLSDWSPTALERKELIVLSGWVSVDLPGWHTTFLGSSHGTLLSGGADVYGESSVLLLGESRAIAFERGSVIARENSRAVLHGEAKGIFVGDSRGVLWDKAYALSLEDTSLQAHGHSYVVLRGRSKGVLSESSSYSAFEEAKVYATPGVESRILGKKVKVELVASSTALESDFAFESELSYICHE